VRANRRKEIFRAVRGSQLTGQRGSWSGESGHLAASGKKTVVDDDEPQPKRRLRLGGVVEDEADDAEARDTRRYSEPND
jgi:hypothetical protein